MTVSHFYHRHPRLRLFFKIAQPNGKHNSKHYFNSAPSISKLLTQGVFLTLINMRLPNVRVKNLKKCLVIKQMLFCLKYKGYVAD